jgi:hypothetical protein
MDRCDYCGKRYICYSVIAVAVVTLFPQKVDLSRFSSVQFGYEWNHTKISEADGHVMFESIITPSPWILKKTTENQRITVNTFKPSLSQIQIQ